MNGSTRWSLGALLCAGGLMMTQPGCSSTTGHSQTSLSPGYLEALEQTQADAHGRPAPGSPEEQEAIQRVQAMWKTFSEENLEAHIEEVYAESLYFRDAFHTFTNRTDLKTYMLESARNVRACTFEFQDVATHDGDVYFRWIMNVSLPSDPEGSLDRSLGISHMRFNQEGKVVFHQDYWDPTDVVYRRIPVARWLIKKVKERM